ncbi:MAG: hypothetical protein IRZ33_06950 [Alicyclobacillaceae bacterium]|nr:hypothetical protein [Alicyclobacillaceae bacterium]
MSLLRLRRYLAVTIAASFAAGCGNIADMPANLAHSVTNTSGMHAGGANVYATSQWMQVDRPHRKVRLTLVADLLSKSDLNGYRRGMMTIVIPRGWTVLGRFENRSRSGAAHSLVLVPWGRQHDEAAVRSAAATSGALTPRPLTGAKPDQVQPFSFKAAQTGHYALVCGVPGHRDTMWATLVISDTEPTPRIYTNVDG